MFGYMRQLVKAREQQLSQEMIRCVAHRSRH